MAYTLRAFPLHDGVEEEFDSFFAKNSDAIIFKAIIASPELGANPMLYVVYE